MQTASRSNLVTLAIFGMLLTASANASQITLTSWTPEFQGIEQAQATILSSADTTVVNTSVAYIDRIDLTAPGIGFTTTPHSGLLATTAQTTSQFLESSGAEVAINANFFAPCCNAAPEAKSLLGLAISNGTVVSAQAFGGDDAAASLLLSHSNQATILAPSSSAASLSNVFNAVSGNQIVTQGVDTSSVVPTGAPHDPFGLDPRTGVGVSQNGQFLYLVVIDGREPGYSVGVTDSDEAGLMLSLGIYNGINLDGGGSTALVQSNGQGGADLIDQPSGGTERYDGNNLGVYANPLLVPEPASLLSLAAALLALVAGRHGRRLFSSFIS